MLPYADSTLRQKGFTLLEIVLVTGIIIVLVSVIIPQAIRTNNASKYNLVQQAAAEIGKWGIEWAERNLESQAAEDTCVLNDYMESLSNVYVNDTGSGNWINVNTTPVCRTSGAILYSVAAMVDPARQPRNPFNGLSYFSTSGGNDGTTNVAGLLYLARYDQDTTTPPTHHYYFVYTGTDSQNATDWYAGMGSGTPLDIANMKNGVYMTRLVQ